METVTIPKREFEESKKKAAKAEVVDDALVQLKSSLEDIKNKRVRKF